jgi:hypothetical protein
MKPVAHISIGNWCNIQTITARIEKKEMKVKIKAVKINLDDPVFKFLSGKTRLELREKHG